MAEGKYNIYNCAISVSKWREGKGKGERRWRERFGPPKKIWRGTPMA